MIHRFDVAALNEPVRARSVVIDTDERQVLFSDWRIDSPTAVSIGPDGERTPPTRAITASPASTTPATLWCWRHWHPRFDGDLAGVPRQPERPNGIAVASNGDVYIADSGNNRIRVVSAATGVIHTAGNRGIRAVRRRRCRARRRRSGEAGAPQHADGRRDWTRGRHLRRRHGTPSGAGDRRGYRVITTIAGDGDPRSAGDGGPAVAAVPPALPGWRSRGRRGR